MTSRNFEFLRPNWEDLATLGGFAEQYAYPDPSTAAAKLRIFAEQAVLFIYHKHGLPKPVQNNLNDLLVNASFEQAVPKVIASKLHTLRIHGNRAAHGENVLTPVALRMLQEAFELGGWMHLNYGGGAKADLPEFVPPSTTDGTEAERKLRRERTAILARVAAQDAEMKRLLAELDASRSRQLVAQATNEELRAAQQQGQQAADTLAFDEATTRRRLIDSLSGVRDRSSADPQWQGQGRLRPVG
jgi:type I restriction enzyme R subunit